MLTSYQQSLNRFSTDLLTFFKVGSSSVLTIVVVSSIFLVNFDKSNKPHSIKFDDYGYLKSFKRKDKVIDALISDAGMFVIITSKKMSAFDALDTYRNRDSIEKLFRAEKSYMGFDCFKVHDDTRLKAKLFILFIALIVRTEVYNCLKPLYLKDSKNFTVPKAIKELEKLYVTKLADDKYHQRYLLTAKQKKILTTFNISEESYKNTVNELLQKLN